eukprot:jgi/Bigna1/83916/fgenesh1_pg.118_\
MHYHVVRVGFFEHNSSSIFTNRGGGSYTRGAAVPENSHLSSSITIENSTLFPLQILENKFVLLFTLNSLSKLSNRLICRSDVDQKRAQQQNPSSSSAHDGNGLCMNKDREQPEESTAKGQMEKRSSPSDDEELVRSNRGAATAHERASDTADRNRSSASLLERRLRKCGWKGGTRMKNQEREEKTNSSDGREQKEEDGNRKEKEKEMREGAGGGGEGGEKAAQANNGSKVEIRKFYNGFGFSELKRLVKEKGYAFPKFANKDSLIECLVNKGKKARGRRSVSESLKSPKWKLRPLQDKPVSSIDEIDWTTATGCEKSETGHGGVFFVKLPQGVVVLKTCADMASQLFASTITSWIGGNIILSPDEFKICAIDNGANFINNDRYFEECRKVFRQFLSSPNTPAKQMEMVRKGVRTMMLRYTGWRVPDEEFLLPIQRGFVSS